MALTPKQSAFVAEYLVDLNGTQAAIRAKVPPGSASVQASKWLANPKVRAEIDAAMARRAARVEVKQDDVLRVLLENLNFDPATVYDDQGNMLSVHLMPVEARKRVQAIEVEQLYEGSGKDKFEIGVTTKLKFWSKDKALELAMRHLGLLRDKTELTGADGGPLEVVVRLETAEDGP